MARTSKVCGADGGELLEQPGELSCVEHGHGLLLFARLVGY